MRYSKRIRLVEAATGKVINTGYRHALKGAKTDLSRFFYGTYKHSNNPLTGAGSREAAITLRKGISKRKIAGDTIKTMAQPIPIGVGVASGAIVGRKKKRTVSGTKSAVLAGLLTGANPGAMVAAAGTSKLVRKKRFHESSLPIRNRLTRKAAKVMRDSFGREAMGKSPNFADKYGSRLMRRLGVEVGRHPKRLGAVIGGAMIPGLAYSGAGGHIIGKNLGKDKTSKHPVLKSHLAGGALYGPVGSVTAAIAAKRSANRRRSR